MDWVSIRWYIFEFCAALTNLHVLFNPLRVDNGSFYRSYKSRILYKIEDETLKKLGLPHERYWARCQRYMKATLQGPQEHDLILPEDDLWISRLNDICSATAELRKCCCIHKVCPQIYARCEFWHEFIGNSGWHKILVTRVCAKFKVS